MAGFRAAVVGRPAAADTVTISTYVMIRVSCQTCTSHNDSDKQELEKTSTESGFEPVNTK